MKIREEEENDPLLYGAYLRTRCFGGYEEGGWLYDHLDHVCSTIATKEELEEWSLKVRVILTGADRRDYFSPCASENRVDDNDIHASDIVFHRERWATDHQTVSKMSFVEAKEGQEKVLFLAR
jgi:hypothetical protein